VAAKGSTGQTVLVIGIIASVAMGVGSTFLQLLNPKGDYDKMTVRVDTLERDIRWNFITKESEGKDVGHIKDIEAKDVARIDRDISELKVALSDLNKSINTTYSAKDVLVSLQNRIAELERVIRDTTRQPVPVTQK
jgi:hypothetical protein